MELLNNQGETIYVDRGDRFGVAFFKMLNFIKCPDDKDKQRSDILQQLDVFYRDIMNYGFADSHNQLLQDEYFELVAKNLNEINQLSLDPLTGLRKKEFLKRKLISLENEIYNQTATDFSLIMCDLDKFKEVNDNFGHSVGDDTLALFGKLILQSLRPCDFAYRYGGEEFLILLPETNLSGAVAIAERIRSIIDDRLQLGNYGLNHITAYDLPLSVIEEEIEDDINNAFFLAKGITSSFGIANYLDCCLSTENLFTHADEKLYVAKKNGRNRVEY